MFAFCPVKQQNIMLDTIINLQNDHNLDVFTKLVIYKANQFNSFDRFSSDETIDGILTTVNENADILYIDLLPENLKVSHSQTSKNNSLSYRNSINFVVTPQTKAIQTILQKFKNAEVFVCLQKVDTQHLYGTPKQPLLFAYSELNNVSHGKIKGYTIYISGKTIEESRFVNKADFDFVSKLLASPLATPL